MIACGIGPQPALGMIVVEASTRQGHVFTVQQEKLVEAALRCYGLSTRENVYATAIVKEWVEDDSETTMAQMVEAWMPVFEMERQSTAPKAILALGGRCGCAVTGVGVEGVLPAGSMVDGVYVVGYPRSYYADHPAWIKSIAPWAEAVRG